MRRNLPTLLSLGNVLAGVCSAMLFVNDMPGLSLVLIIIAGVLDVLDGWAARRVGGTGRRGKLVDAVADLVSFGFVPAFMLSVALPTVTGYIISALYASAIAFRLIRFWRSEGAPGEFNGMPSPAAAIATVSGVVMAVSFPGADWMAPSAAMLFAAFAVSRVPYPKLGHPSLALLPYWGRVLIYGAHIMLFPLAQGLAGLSLMLIYLVLGPMLLTRYRQMQTGSES